MWVLPKDGGGTDAFKSISYLSTDDVNVRECVVDQSFDYYRTKETENERQRNNKTISNKHLITGLSGATEPIVLNILQCYITSYWVNPIQRDQTIILDGMRAF